ncbi:deoxynucleoside kinase [Candidatus Woesearchaeota archaeon]|nr:deoxynucleoside kinase [Candidatus Woesearchaeota archaeon]
MQYVMLDGHILLGKSLLIECAGNIGLGKSALAQLLEKHGAKAWYERPEAIPLLHKFYDDMPKYALPLQCALLQMRSQHVKQAKQHLGIAVIDRSRYEEFLIFCNVLHHLGHLSTTDYEQFELQCRLTLASLPKPDLVVHVTGTSELAWNGVMARQRVLELKSKYAVTQEYLSLLHERYTTFEQRLTTFYRGRCPANR